MKFIIVGSGRCGTTFLRNALSRLPDCFVSEESYWHAVLLAKYGDSLAPVESMLADIRRVRFHTGQPTLSVTLGLIDETLPPFLAEIEALFADRLVSLKDVCSAIEAAILRRTDKTVFGDKSPHYGYHLPELRRLWPDLKVVHAIRDGRECAASMSKHEGFQILAGLGIDDWTAVAGVADRLRIQPMQADNGVYLDMWARQITQITMAMQSIPVADCFTIRYEEMLNEPTAILCRLVDFLGLRRSTEWLTAAAAEVTTRAGTRAVVEHIRPSLYAAAALAAVGY